MLPKTSWVALLTIVGSKLIAYSGLHTQNEEEVSKALEGVWKSQHQLAIPTPAHLPSSRCASLGASGESHSSGQALQHTQLSKMGFHACHKLLERRILDTIYTFNLATPTTCGSSQARDQTHAPAVNRATAVTTPDP